MRVIIVDTATEVAQTGGDIFLQQLKCKPESVFGLATGSSPVALYQHLISAHVEDAVSFSGVTTFNLDEYLGLTGEHPQSYRFFMQRNLFDHIGQGVKVLGLEVSKSLAKGNREYFQHRSGHVRLVYSLTHFLDFESIREGVKTIKEVLKKVNHLP